MNKVAILFAFLLPNFLFGEETPSCTESAEAINIATPQYPLVLGAPRNVNGYALVEFEIQTNGSVLNPKVIEANSSPYHKGMASGFGRSATKAILKSTFKPQKTNCLSKYKYVYQVER